jgi:hypothetical protein
VAAMSAGIALIDGIVSYRQALHREHCRRVKPCGFGKPACPSGLLRHRTRLGFRQRRQSLGTRRPRTVPRSGGRHDRRGAPGLVALCY